MWISRLLKTLIGFRRWKPAVARRESGAALGLSYLAFKDLTTSNDQLLEVIADIERKLQGGSYFGPAYVRNRAVHCASLAYRMVLSLDRLSFRRYQELHLVFAAIRKAIEEPIAKAQARGAAPSPLTCPLDSVDARALDMVGGKAAHVGELRNIGLPVPDGFVVSTAAFSSLLGHEGLGEQIAALLSGRDAGEPGDVEELSREVGRLVRGTALPPALAEAIDAEFGRLCRRGGGAARVSMRSSALGEDGAVSFAGQYVTVLNVAPAHLFDAYREVVAGLYSPSALYYRRLHGIPDEDVVMAALCMPMIEARASGVACSVDPGKPGSGSLLLSGSWGLGASTVGGTVSPDLWQVSRTADLRVEHASLGRKLTRVESLPGGGAGSHDVPAGARAAWCLSEEQVRELARLTLRAEQHYGAPQELEWALDPEGRFFLLQARPLRVVHSPAEGAAVSVAAAGQRRVLLRGAAASPGSASGPVFRMTDLQALAGFPDGAVLVARHSSPRLVQVMGRAAAIVTDIGAVTGHMASLAREFGVPAILDTGIATSTLMDGQVVTVSADDGAVYEGLVESVLRPRPSVARAMAGSPAFALLREVAAHIVPLNLTDRRSPDFRPRGCRTLHDLARFAHEKAFEEMFRLSDRVADATERAVVLEGRLPFELHLIDIGGGLAPGTAARATPGQVRSIPMAALLEGMLHPGLRWWEPRPISFSGFLSVAAESMIAGDSDGGQRELGDRSYAIVAESYCNFSSRIGYHFAAVDSYCSDFPTRNYVSFRFEGGAADAPRRARRCQLIAEVLRRLDFGVECTGDLVVTRLRKYPRAEISTRLDLLGRLIVATRQLDMRMAPGEPADWFVKAFFDGNYLFEPPTGQRP